MKNALPYSLRRSALTLLALCAIFFQAAVVQAHVHFPAFAGQPEVHDGGGAGAAPERAAVGVHAACGWCQGLALGRALDRVSPLVLDAPIQSACRTAPDVEAAPAIALSHHWNSRAPPTLL